MTITTDIYKIILTGRSITITPLIEQVSNDLQYRMEAGYTSSSFEEKNFTIRTDLKNSRRAINADFFELRRIKNLYTTLDMKEFHISLEHVGVPFNRTAWIVFRNPEGHQSHAPTIWRIEAGRTRKIEIPMPFKLPKNGEQPAVEIKRVDGKYCVYEANLCFGAIKGFRKIHRKGFDAHTDANNDGLFWVNRDDFAW